MPYRDIDDALTRANATNYGLGGSIWTSNMERGAELATCLECGTAWVNKHITFTPFYPFGGMKQSGIGRQNGVLGLEELTEAQVVYVA
jgi:acyl-CoA reductase-like NAD-dependent aldehyde dehydrogenase